MLIVNSWGTAALKSPMNKCAFSFAAPRPMNDWCILQDACLLVACLLVADCQTEVAGFSLVTGERCESIYTLTRRERVAALCAAPSSRNVLICLNQVNRIVEVDVNVCAVRRTFVLKAYPTSLSEVACNHLHVVVQSCPEAVVYVFSYDDTTLQAVIRPSVCKPRPLGLAIRSNNRGFIVADTIGFCFYDWGGALERRCVFPDKDHSIHDSSVAGNALVSSRLSPVSGLIYDTEYLVGVDLEADQSQMFANARPAFSYRDLLARVGLPTDEYVSFAVTNAQALMVVVTLDGDLDPSRVSVIHGLALRLAWVQAGVMCGFSLVLE